MQTKSQSIVVMMPGDIPLDVVYYCKDDKLPSHEKQEHTELIIQLHDCICKIKIEKSLCRKKEILENIVHNKVIHERGHLC